MRSISTISSCPDTETVGDVLAAGAEAHGAAGAVVAGAIVAAEICRRNMFEVENLALMDPVLLYNPKTAFFSSPMNVVDVMSPLKERPPKSNFSSVSRSLEANLEI